jgi:hypothetical protein
LIDVSMMEAGRRGAIIAVRCSGDVIRVGQRVEGGGPDGWGLLGSDVREGKRR